MGIHDVIAQLRQDITTAQDAGDDATAERLRGDLDEAIKAAGGDPGRDSDDGAGGLGGTVVAPQPPDIPGSNPEDLQEPPD